MPRAGRICADCATITAPGKRRCAECARQYEQSRGSRQQRGYDNGHDKTRQRLARRVHAGLVDCWRCGQRIERGERWDLGHLDDRSAYGGPEHAHCNRSAGGKAAHIDGGSNGSSQEGRA